LCHWNFSVT